MLWLNMQSGKADVQRVHGTGQVSAALLGEQESGKQAAGADRMVSSLAVSCETAGNSVIVYSSCGM